jgi:SAM-dependent methyltransferase
VRRLDRTLQRLRIGQVAPFIARGSRVLDVGCSEGELYTQVPGIVRYVGVDPDAPVGRSTGDMRFVKDVFPTAGIDQAEQFDAIVALAVLEHVPRAAQGDFASACARHLAPGGVLAITLPSPVVDSIIALFKRIRILDGMHDEQHYGFDPTTTASIFQPHGLRLRVHRRFELGLNHLFVFEHAA